MNTPSSVPCVFSFSGRTYKARLLKAAKPEDDAIVFGLGLNLKLDKVYIVYRSSEKTGSHEAWWTPKGRLTPLARAAIAAVGA